MDTSLENIRKEQEDKKKDSDRKKRKKLREMENPVWGFMWRFLLCCVVIDIPVWAYFHFMKDDSSATRKINKKSQYQSAKIEQYEPSEKITSNEEISKYNNLIQIEKKYQKEELPINRIISNRPVEQINSQQPKPQQPNRPSGRQIMYSWINEDGHKIFSNKGFPEDGNFTEGKIERY